jgi:hypothetical protein
MDDEGGQDKNCSWDHYTEPPSIHYTEHNSKHPTGLSRQSGRYTYHTPDSLPCRPSSSSKRLSICKIAIFIFSRTVGALSMLSSTSGL